MSPYESYIYHSRYARYLDDKGRREHWDETVNRYLDFFEERHPKHVKPVRQELYDAIYNFETLPSMRALMTAGPALERDHVAGYNCSYLPIDCLRSFDELFYILLCGTGVGYSVERQYISELPEVAEEFHDTDTTIVVADSKIGWAKALKETIAMAFAGQIPNWDFSRVRPAGARLKTFGGRASGHSALEHMLKQVVNVIRSAAGRKLTSIEAHDICCHIAKSVVVGGVRRAAMISLSNLTDERMAKAKSGQWWQMDEQRALANNSVAFTEKPDVGAFLNEWTTIYESKSGERGIFNRNAARNLSPERRDRDYDFGTNPCSEIVLRPRQFCNLTEVVARADDHFESLARKVRAAAILGTLQSCLTDFRYLGSGWKKNCEEERLLGVSITGIYDCPYLMKCPDEDLQALRDIAVQTNKEWAKKLGVNQSAAVTCVKPSGTVSQLVSSSSGIHPQYSRYYYRRVRGDNKDPVTAAMIQAGVPHEIDPYNSEATVFTFVKKAPKGAVVMEDITAIEHLEMWKRFQLNWCEHKPSVTVSVGEDEWPAVGAWCWENFDILSGISFLPKEDSNHTYKAAPYERISAEEYRSYPKFPAINWDLVEENPDKETEFACSAGACDI